MPEGDTIFRTADVLRAALVGRRIVAARARPQPGLRSVPDLSRLAGTTVSAVEPRGKHLLIRFDDGSTLRSHMRMRGSWHRYRPGERWRLPERRATAVLETPEAVAVCFDAPVMELLAPDALRRSRPLRELGPDLLGDDPDLDEAVRRLRVLDAAEIGEALLDQRAAAGIGNVVKAETLFLEGVDPWVRVATLDDATLRRLLARGRQILAANTGGGARVTTGDRRPGRGLWVYGRAGRPCRRCGTPVAVRRQGALARPTFWCPACQGGVPARPRSG